MGKQKNPLRVPIVILDPTKGEAPATSIAGAGLVMDHLTGANPTTPQANPAEITKDNFEDLAGLRPKLQLKVADKLTSGQEKLAVTIEFSRPPGEWPRQVTEQMQPLKELVDLREALLALKSRCRNDGEFARRVKALLVGDDGGLRKLLPAPPALPEKK